MPLCQQKSKLIEILKSLQPPPPPQSSSPNNKQTSPTTAITATPHERTFSVAIVDGMAELQALDNSKGIQTCTDLAEAFTKKTEKKYWEYKEIHLVFDTYKENSIQRKFNQEYDEAKEAPGNCANPL